MSPQRKKHWWKSKHRVESWKSKPNKNRITKWIHWWKRSRIRNKELWKSKSKIIRRLDLILFISFISVATYLYYHPPILRKKTVYITSSENKRVTLIKGSLKGTLDRVIAKDNQIEFIGWAFDVKNSQLPKDILISYKGENIFWGQTNYSKKGLAKLYGQAALKSGFKFKLPLELFKDKELDTSQLRLFAFSKEAVSELYYYKGFRVSEGEITTKVNNTSNKNPIQTNSIKVNKATKDDYITYANGLKIPLAKNALKGLLEKVNLENNNKVELIGWAIDLKNPHLPVVIMVLHKGENIYWGQNNVNRPDLSKKYSNTLLKSGFRFELPLKMFKVDNLDISELRVFAFSNGVATELNYFKGFK